MDLNFFFIFWFLIVALICLLNFLNKFEQFALSKWIDLFLLYGKEKKQYCFENKDEIRPMIIDLISNLQVPKSYFIHFYLFGLLIQSLIVLIYYLINSNGNLFHLFIQLNQIIFSTKSIQFLDSISNLQSGLAFLFLNLHILRRFYETNYVSIFSKSSIHIFHYIIGYLFYGSICLLQFNILFRNNDLQIVTIHYFNLIIGSLIFLIGSFIQHITLRKFALLRIKKKSSINNSDNQHFIPNDFMFKFISCPHYLGEILIYLGICLLLEWYINVFIIFLWTFISHINMSRQSHNWYLKHFGDNYPKDRKALIPFIM